MSTNYQNHQDKKKNADFDYIDINNAKNKARYEDNDVEMGYDYEKTYNVNLRLGFIRKVYGILSIQLLITTFLCSLTFIDAVKVFFQTNVWLFWTCLILSIVVIIPLICFKSVSTKVPTNYIMLLIWTFCEAYMVATCCSFYEPKIVLAAAALTCAVTLGLTYYACTTKTDFTVCGGFLFVAGILLLFLGLLSIFLPFLHTLYCVLGVLLYSVYLLFDTQLIMGKYENGYEIDDYIIAAIMIYIDIIQIFLYLLELFGNRNN